MFSSVYSIFFYTSFCVFEEYSGRHSLQYSVQYNVQCSVYYSLQYNFQYSVQYSVIYSLKEAGKGLFLSSATHFDVWLQFIVHYSVQCTVQCTFNFSVQYMYVGCPGTQWDVTIQPVKTKPKLLCQNKSYVGHNLVA